MVQRPSFPCKDTIFHIAKNLHVGEKENQAANGLAVLGTARYAANPEILVHF